MRVILNLVASGHPGGIADVGPTGACCGALTFWGGRRAADGSRVASARLSRETGADWIGGLMRIEWRMMTSVRYSPGLAALTSRPERAGLTCKWQVEIDGQFLSSSCSRNIGRTCRNMTTFVRFPKKKERLVCRRYRRGVPLQDISFAGKGAGLAGARSGWYEFARVVPRIRPRYVLVENVAALTVRGGLDAVSGRWPASGT